MISSLLFLCTVNSISSKYTHSQTKATATTEASLQDFFKNQEKNGTPAVYDFAW